MKSATVNYDEYPDFPEWMTDAGKATLAGGYYGPGETCAKDIYKRLAKSAAKRYSRGFSSPEFRDLEKRFFLAMWKGWLCPATPVLSNLGLERGLPISCFGIHVPDSVDGIYTKLHEQASLSKNGGGVGVYLGEVRGRGEPIKDNGHSEGVVPWAKVFDSSTAAVNQGSTRRGASVLTLDVDHMDVEEFIRIRKPMGDPNRQCMNIHHSVSISDEFMQKVKSGDLDARALWLEILKTRLETGEPYLFYKKNMNADRPKGYVDRGLEVHQSNLCTEIALTTDEEHSFVCCLSSVNLASYADWHRSDLIELSILFLDAVMQEFIDKARRLPGMKPAVRFAEKSRALGLGVLGFHTLLQDSGIVFGSRDSMDLNREIFSRIRTQAERASELLARFIKQPEWCAGTRRAHTHLTAVAPTLSNSLIAGELSPGIEPIAANVFTRKTAKGTFYVRNPSLQRELAALGMDTEEVWSSITVNQGSVQHLDVPQDIKDVYRTAAEINQLDVVRLAAQRQVFLEQAQSLNLFFPADVSSRFFNQVHLEAYDSGVKSLYYVRSQSVLQADAASRVQSTDCEACDG